MDELESYSSTTSTDRSRQDIVRKERDMTEGDEAGKIKSNEVAKGHANDCTAGDEPDDSDLGGGLHGKYLSLESWMSSRHELIKIEQLLTNAIVTLIVHKCTATHTKHCKQSTFLPH